jgi:hypothetical protein
MAIGSFPLVAFCLWESSKKTGARNTGKIGTWWLNATKFALQEVVQCRRHALRLSKTCNKAQVEHRQGRQAFDIAKRNQTRRHTRLRQANDGKARLCHSDQPMQAAA